METLGSHYVHSFLDYLTVKVYLRLKIATTGTDNGGTSFTTVTWDFAMSTAAHEPRRVGPRRADSPSGSKVTPRRNAADVNEPGGVQYDSDEIPVLIRLPDLRTVGAADSPSTTAAQQKKHRIDRPSANKQTQSQHKSEKVSKKPLPQQAGHNKLVIAGVIGGLLVLALLFLFNSGSKQPIEQDGWANQDIEISIEEPELAVSSGVETPKLSPPPPAPTTFEYGTPDNSQEQFASSESEQLPLKSPYYEAAQKPLQTQLLAPQSDQSSIAAWPSEETMGASVPAQPAPADLWPGERLTAEQGGYQYPPTNSPSERDYQSSRYPSQTDTYRMGKLDTDRPQAVQRDRNGILDGNIAIPDTKLQ